MSSLICESQCVGELGLFVMKTSSLCGVVVEVVVVVVVPICDTRGVLRTRVRDVNEKSSARVVAGMPDVRDHMEDSKGTVLTRVGADAAELGKDRMRTSPLLVERRLPLGTTMACTLLVQTTWPWSASSHSPLWHGARSHIFPRIVPHTLYLSVLEDSCNQKASSLSI